MFDSLFLPEHPVTSKERVIDRPYLMVSNRSLARYSNAQSPYEDCRSHGSTL